MSNDHLEMPMGERFNMLKSEAADLLEKVRYKADQAGQHRNRVLWSGEATDEEIDEAEKAVEDARNGIAALNSLTSLPELPAEIAKLGWTYVLERSPSHDPLYDIRKIGEELQAVLEKVQEAGFDGSCWTQYLSYTVGGFEV